MYMLTKKKGDLESGAYASVDDDGITIIQFFVDKDDATTYNTHLEALGQDLFVTETKSDEIDKLCSILGYAYTIVEPGDFVIPRIETITNDLL